MSSESDKDTSQGVLEQTQSTSGNSTLKNDGSYQYHNGRPYYDRDDVAYVLPADDEETDRLRKQHWLVKTVSGSNYGAPVTDALVEGINVHDAGCGSGTWSLEMATDYPNSKLYGTDISTRFPEANKPANCHFKSLNLLTSSVFPENHFGYIHQRFLAGGLPNNHWEKLIEEHVRTLAPGGWLEVVEPRFPVVIKSGPPKLSAMLSAFLAIGSMKGLSTTIDDELEDMFRRAGLINIHTVSFSFPMGETTQVGQLAWEDISGAFTSLVPHTASIYPELQSEENLNRFKQETREECLEHRPVLPLLRVCGQKRL